MPESSKLITLACGTVIVKILIKLPLCCDVILPAATVALTSLGPLILQYILTTASLLPEFQCDINTSFKFCPGLSVVRVYNVFVLSVFTKLKLSVLTAPPCTCNGSLLL